MLPGDDARNLAAPPLARTQSTAVLTWDRPAVEGIASYQIYRDGILAGETKRLSYTERSLAPGQSYRFTVRSSQAAGKTSAESETIVVETKSAGHISSAAPSPIRTTSSPTL